MTLILSASFFLSPLPIVCYPALIIRECMIVSSKRRLHAHAQCIHGKGSSRLLDPRNCELVRIALCSDRSSWNTSPVHSG